MASKIAKSRERPQCQYHQGGGNCRMGKNCLYLHGLSDPSALAFPLDKWKMGTQETCLFHLHNRSCRFGEYCQYYHDPNAKILPYNLPSQPVQQTASYEAKTENFPLLGEQVAPATNGIDNVEQTKVQEKKPEPDKVEMNANLDQNQESKSVAQVNVESKVRGEGVATLNGSEPVKQEVTVREEGKVNVVETTVNGANSELSNGDGVSAAAPNVPRHRASSRSGLTLEERLKLIDERDGAGQQPQTSTRAEMLNSAPYYNPPGRHVEPMQTNTSVANTEASPMSDYDREILELKKKLEILELKNKIEAMERQAKQQQQQQVVPPPSVQYPQPAPAFSESSLGFGAPPGLDSIGLPPPSLNPPTSATPPLQNTGFNTSLSLGDGYQSYSFNGPMQSRLSNANVPAPFEQSRRLSHSSSSSLHLQQPSVDESFIWHCVRCSAVNNANYTSCATCFLVRDASFETSPASQSEDLAPPPGFSITDSNSSIVLEQVEVSPTMDISPHLDGSTFQSEVQHTTEFGEQEFVAQEPETEVQQPQSPEIVEPMATPPEPEQAKETAPVVVHEETKGVEEAQGPAFDVPTSEPVKTGWAALFSSKQGQQTTPVVQQTAPVKEKQVSEPSFKQEQQASFAAVAGDTSGDQELEWECVHCHEWNQPKTVACHSCHFSKYTGGKAKVEEKVSHVKNNTRKTVESKKNKKNKKKQEVAEPFKLMEYVPEADIVDKEERKRLKAERRKAEREQKQLEKEQKEDAEKAKKGAQPGNNKKKAVKKGEEKENKPVVTKGSKEETAKQTTKTSDKKSESKVDAQVQAKVMELKKQGDSFLKKKKYKNALKCYGEASELDPSNALFFNSCGNLQLLLKCPTEALEQFKKAQALDDQHFKCYLGMGKAYYSLGAVNKSKNAFNTAIQLKTKVKSECEAQLKEVEYMSKLVNTVSELVRKEKWLSAKEKATEGLKRMAKCRPLLRLKEQIEEHQNRVIEKEEREVKKELIQLMSYADNKVLLKKAELKARNVVKEHPEDAEALKLLSQVLCSQGKLDEALPFIKKASTLDSTCIEDCKLVESMIAAEEFAYKQWDAKEWKTCRTAAVAALGEGVIKLYESSLRARMRILIGDCSLRLGETKRAKEVYEAAIKQDSSFLPDAHVHLSLALLYYGDVLTCDTGIPNVLQTVINQCNAGIKIAGIGSELLKRFVTLQKKCSEWLEAIRTQDSSRICTCCGRLMTNGLDSGSELEYDDEYEYSDEEDDGDSFISESVDYYQDLGCEEYDDVETLKAAYDKICAAVSSKKAEDLSGEEIDKFKNAITAYHVLKNPDLREKFDEGALTLREVAHQSMLAQYVGLMEDLNCFDEFSRLSLGYATTGP